MAVQSNEMEEECSPTRHGVCDQTVTVALQSITFVLLIHRAKYCRAKYGVCNDRNMIYLLVYAVF